MRGRRTLYFDYPDLFRRCSRVRRCAARRCHFRQWRMRDRRIKVRIMAAHAGRRVGQRRWRRRGAVLLLPKAREKARLLLLLPVGFVATTFARRERVRLGHGSVPIRDAARCRRARLVEREPTARSGRGHCRRAREPGSARAGTDRASIVLKDPPESGRSRLLQLCAFVVRQRSRTLAPSRAVAEDPPQA